MDELNNLEKIAQNSRYCEGVSSPCIRYCCEVFKRHLRPGSILELGPAEGLMTDILYPRYPDYTVVDGSETFIQSIKSRHPDIKAVTALFEDFLAPPRDVPLKYNNIILGHVLEHVADPAGILSMCKTYLRDNGVVLAAVPNKNSIHRQAAVKMGLIEALDAFSEKDLWHGHRRVFGMDSFLNVFKTAGLSIIKSGGYWLKPYIGQPNKRALDA